MKIGVDLGGHTINAALIEGTSIIKKIQQNTPPSRNPKDTVNIIKNMIEDLARGAHVDLVGIGVPGLVSKNRDRIVKLTNLPDWEDLPLPSLIKSKFPLSVKIDNDANCSAIGEMMAGAGLKYSDFLVITLGTGIGGAIVVDGKLVRGHLGFAGEIGQIPIAGTTTASRPDTNLESYFSADTFDDRCIKFNVENTKKLWKLRNSEEHSLFWDRSLNILSCSIAGYIQIMDPAAIVMTGGLTNLSGIVKEIRSMVLDKLLPRNRPAPSIIKSSRGEEIAMIGASSL